MLYYLLDGWQRGFVCEELLHGGPSRLICSQMGSSGTEYHSPSFSVGFKAGQPYVVAGVDFGIVQTANTVLLGILWLVSPQEFDVACSTAVILGLSEMQNVIDLADELDPVALVSSLIGHELPSNELAEVLLGELSDLGTLLWGADHPCELAHILHS